MSSFSKTLEILLLELPSIKEQHAPTHPCYALLKKLAKENATALFSESKEQAQHFAPFGTLNFPYCKMGAIDSLDLFGIDELILFSFYWHNRNRYKKVVDIGGNIGLHSILLNKCGFEVQTYEPDPQHFKKLNHHLALNGCQGVKTHNKAVSYKTGSAEFVRVIGNTTSNHLAGSKQPYGELERVTVSLEDFKNILPTIDLIKMDVEGHEKDILVNTEKQHWKNKDALVEIGSLENAKAVFAHFQKIGVCTFAQKVGWKQVERLEDMPTSHREGSLFITCENSMPW